jgi:uncharacterized protein YgiB involved in biofilm formation
MNRVRKSRYVTVLMAATALAACDQNVMTGPGSGDAGTIYGSAADCAKDFDANACSQAFETAKTQHQAQAPKFASAAECEAAGFNKCEEATAQQPTGTEQANAGTQTGGSFFMPMMMGYMMGRMLGGPGMMPGAGAPVGAPGAQTPGTGARPVYADRNGYLFADNRSNPLGRVAPGATSLPPGGVAARTTSRGGFGSSARGVSGGA